MEAALTPGICVVNAPIQLEVKGEASVAIPDASRVTAVPVAVAVKIIGEPKNAEHD
jgi:hypothetical protein